MVIQRLTVWLGVSFGWLQCWRPLWSWVSSGLSTRGPHSCIPARRTLKLPSGPLPVGLGNGNLQWGHNNVTMV